jgi:dipeptidyl aminopeptidase/acylaminoacyl peptidase
MKPLHHRLFFSVLPAVAATLMGCGSSSAQPDPLSTGTGAASSTACVSPNVRALVTEKESIWSPLLLDDSFVYYISDRSGGAGPQTSDLVRVQKSGGTPQLLATLHTLSPLAHLMALDAMNVYYVDDLDGGDHQVVYKIAKDGRGSPVKLAEVGKLVGMLVDKDSLFLGSRAASVVSGTTVSRIDLGTLASTEISRLPGDDTSGELVADDDSLFWSSQKGIMKAPKRGGAAEIIVKTDQKRAGYHAVLPLFVDAEFLYFYGGDDGILGAYFRVAKDGSGAVQHLGDAGGLAKASAAVDGETVYFAQGTVSRSPKAGGRSETIETCPSPGASTIAVDETSIYFNSGAQILAVPRAGH